jgi:hypothetical protein
VKIGMHVRVSLGLCVMMLSCFTTAAFAVDGVVLIDQNRALAGNVTPGDAPGFPVTLSVRGSYRLSSSLIVPAETDGIVIAADGVSVDLNGFQIVGDGGGAGVTEGLGATFGLSVRNGSVSGFSNGIFIAARASEIRDIRAFNNTSAGIRVASGILVTGNSLTRNGIGIKAFRDSLITGNVASFNDVGIDALQNSTISGNTTAGNIVGIKVLCPSGLVGNTSDGNLELDIDEDVQITPCSRANNHPKP